MPRTTVLLADDHPVNAALLRDLLETTFDVVGEVADGISLVDAVERLSPDVIVTDIAMPGLDGIQAASRILAKNASARIVLVTVHNDSALVERALGLGALGFVVKSVAGDELIPAVHAALKGEQHVAGMAVAGGSWTIGTR